MQRSATSILHTPSNKYCPQGFASLSYRACSMGGTSQSMVSSLCTASASCLLNDVCCPLLAVSLCTCMCSVIADIRSTLTHVEG